MSKEVKTITVDGRPIHIHDRPGKIAKCFDGGTPYESMLLNHIKEQVFTGWALDVGANIGNHSLWFAVACGLRVMAFEPLVIGELHANVALNNLEDTIIIKHVALGSAPGMLHHVGKGRLAPLTESAGGAVVGYPAPGGTVPVRTLDSYEPWLRGPIALIKIDVEGMEAEVLKGAKETLTNSRPVLYTEVWTEEYEQRIADVVEPLGYQRGSRMQQGRMTPMRRWDP